MGKSFKSAAPRINGEFDINGETFRFHQDIPGAVLLDFMSNTEEDDPSALAATVHSLLNESIIAEDKERFNAYIRDRANNVSLELLAEICGYIGESASGNERLPNSLGVG